MDPRRRILKAAKTRAKSKGVPFSITVDDIVVPEFCPLLGIELGATAGHDSLPSLDRKRPGLGYVPGNVWVISNRANRIKNDSTPQELLAIAFGLLNAGL